MGWNGLSGRSCTYVGSKRNAQTDISTYDSALFTHFMTVVVILVLFDDCFLISSELRINLSQRQELQNNVYSKEG